MSAKLVGILGGTFNPIHFGHLRLAEELKENLHLDQVRFVPSANPPHKTPPKVTAEMRAKMVADAISDNPTFVLDTQELAREGASYTIDTLKQLKQTLGTNCSLCFIMGNDAFIQLETWHQWESLLDYCHIVLVNRPQNIEPDQASLSARLQLFLSEHYTENPDDLAETPHGLIHMQAITPLMISSTQIRANIQAKQSIRYLTPHHVVNTIAQEALYL